MRGAPLLLALSATAARGQSAPPADTTRPAARIPEITITAAPARRDDPSSGRSLAPRVLRSAPALNTYDRLRLAGGLEVHDQGQGPGFASNASLRGFTSDHSTDLALWLDGVPINEPVNGHAEGYNDWAVIFPQAIRSVEIFKGPTSALYGNFAMAGVINVRTLERKEGMEGEFATGAFGRFEGAILTGWDHAASGGVLGIRAEREGGWRPNSRYQLGQAHFRTQRNVGANANLDGGLELYGAGWDSPGFLTLDQYRARAFDNVSNATDGGFKHRAQERVSLRLVGGSSLLWRTTVFSTQSRWQLYLTTPPEGGTTEGTGSQLDEEDRRYGFGATSALTWAGERGEVTVGGEARWDHSDYQNWFVTNRRRDSAQVLAVASQLAGALFVQASTPIGDRLTLSLGGRADLLRARSTPDGRSATSDSRRIFTPKAGVLLRLPGFGSTYVNLSRGFRQTDGVVEDPTLPFITEWGYEAGLKFDRRAVSASAALFRMEVSNEQTFNPLAAVSTSGGASRRQGVELSFDAQLGEVASVRSEWTLLDARYRNLVTADGESLAGARVFNTAKYFGMISAALGRPSGRWALAASSNLVGPYSPFGAPGETESAYALFHLSGRVAAGRVRFDLGLRNLLGRTYQELRAGRFVVPGQPRTFYGGVTWDLGASRP